MSDFIPSPLFEEQVRKAMATPEPRQPFKWHLRTRLLSQANRMKTRTSPVYAWIVRAVAAIVVIGVLALFVTTPEVASAMRRLVGYIPGLGLAEQSTLRVLTAPVVTERDGISFTVKQGFADTERTVLLLEAEGFPAGAGGEEENSEASCQGSPQLRLLDNSTLQVTEGTGHGWDTGYTQRLVFPALPQELNDFILEVPCLLSVAQGQWPGGWVIPLHLAPASPDAVAPVIQLPPTPVTPNTQAEAGGESSFNNEDNAPNYFITFSLENVVNLGDGYIFMCSTRWQDELIADYGVRPAYVTITDAEGTEIPLMEVAPDQFAPVEQKTTNTAYQIEGRLFNWPLTLSVEAMEVDIRTEAGFTFSPGVEISPGMSWQLNLNVPVDRYTLQISGAEAVYTDEYSAMSFTMYSDDDIIRAHLVDPEREILGGGGGGEPVLGEFLSSVQYPAFPSGVLNLDIIEISLLQYGPWEVPWQP